MTCFEMQHTNMISTSLQEENRGRLSSHIKLIVLMNLTMNLKKITWNDSDEDDQPPYSIFQSSFNSTEPKKPTKVFNPYQLWGDFSEAAKHMIIDYNKKIKVVHPRPHFNGGNTKPKSTFGTM